MKTIALGFILTGFLFVSCNKEIGSSDFSLGNEVNFQIGSSYFANDNALKFKISEINDSRCPSDVVCVWAGKADVKIELSSPLSSTITLNTWNNQTDTIGNYSFKLVGVSPYPVSTKIIKTEDYDVKLIIAKIGK